ncbi:hypothetical protein LZK73_01000 [Neorhizobium galegae]|nr:hypothetical protein LZK73_01000 [Neorhizobium galegae]
MTTEAHIFVWVSFFRIPAELPEDRDQDFWVEIERRSLAIGNRPEPFIIVAIAESQAEMGGSARQIRFEISAIDRPAGIRNPRPFFIIDGVEGAATSTPGVGASANDTIANGPLVTGTRAADIVDLVKRIHPGIAGHAAALQKSDAQVRIRQFLCKRRASWS